MSEQTTDMQECMKNMPQPTAAHAWLERYVGEWRTRATITPPDMPPMESEGVEVCRMIGGFWMVADGQVLKGMPYTYRLTIGYDASRGIYIGTWVDSMTDHLWFYEGNVNEAGDTLELRTSGPCPMGYMMNSREVMEFRSSDHRVFTCHTQEQGKDGWQPAMVVEYHRK